MNTNDGRRLSYRTMIVLAVVVGALSIALQFTPDGEILAFMLGVATLGTLIGGSKAYNERERQQLRQSYKTAYGSLLLTIMTAYALVVVSRSFNIFERVTIVLNSHWPGLVISMMCLLIGIAGFQRIDSESSA